MTNYVLVVAKEDANIWKDFFRINSRFMHVGAHGIDNDTKMVYIHFTPVIGCWGTLRRAFQMEKEMGTIFTIKVDL